MCGMIRKSESEGLRRFFRLKPGLKIKCSAYRVESASKWCDQIVGARRWRQPLGTAHKKFVACRFPKTRERRAHGWLSQADPDGSSRDVPLSHESIECDDEV